MHTAHGAVSMANVSCVCLCVFVLTHLHLKWNFSPFFCTLDGYYSFLVESCGCAFVFKLVGLRKDSQAFEILLFFFTLEINTALVRLHGVLSSAKPMKKGVDPAAMWSSGSLREG